MLLTFHIDYRTLWGEEVKLTGILPKPITLHTSNGIDWETQVEINTPPEGITLQYGYLITKDGTITRNEWRQQPHRLHIDFSGQHSLVVYDLWTDMPQQSFYYSSAFSNVLFARTNTPKQKLTYNQHVIIKVDAPFINPLQHLAICGNQNELGNWNPKNALLMDSSHFPTWQAELDLSSIESDVEYKFILIDPQKPEPLWEQGNNRTLCFEQKQIGHTLVITNPVPEFNLPKWKGTGTAIPLFALKTKGSFGIGDFGDLRTLVDWVASTNQCLIQLLPINDTTKLHTKADSYPYNIISIYALHPIYADIRQMGKLQSKEANERLQRTQQSLNALPCLDYEAVDRAKWEFFHAIYQQNGKRTLSSKAFKSFFNANKEWLFPYAAYCFFRDKYHTPDFQSWPEHTSYNQVLIEKELSDDTNSSIPYLGLYYYIQYHLHRQLSKAREYARKKRVVLKGDIPIGISRDSVEAWTQAELFNLNKQAGAPPDDFSTNGQNWGFPTYNWSKMQNDGYQWWKKRFKKMATYFDAYRIDHILGFFRIWEIPIDTLHGLLGVFSPSLPLDKEEIAGFGLHMNAFYLTPYIHEALLDKLFDDKKEKIKERFLFPIPNTKLYSLRPEFNTQRKIESFFKSSQTNNDANVQQGLYTLICNVLFIEDDKVQGKYHPRIDAFKSDVYQSLSKKEKEAFNALYHYYFYQRHNTFWQQQALRKLPAMIECTDMLTCGEDLGMIPQCVPHVMRQLGILSLEIQRMPKTYGLEFGDPATYPYTSVCSTSTHDTSTLREWWEENPITTQHYYTNYLNLPSKAPKTATPEICELILLNHLLGNSILCIIPLQDWLSIDARYRNHDIHAERINIPSNPEHYWRYRMHLTLEELIEATGLNQKITRLINYANR